MEELQSRAARALVEECPTLTVASIAKKHGYEYRWLIKSYPELCKKRTDFIKTLTKERIKEMRVQTKNKANLLKRICLSCSSEFVTASRFIRICETCKRRSESLNDLNGEYT